MAKVMHAAAPAQTTWSDGARRQTKWDWRAAANFIGGGSGTSLLLFAAVAGFSPDAYQQRAMVALCLIACGLACIMLKMGHPFRALNTLRHPQTSWMTREVLTVPLLFGFGAAAVNDPGNAWFPGATALLGMSFLYCQARILAAAKGIPAWSEPKVIPLIIVTGLAEGAGLFALLAAALPAAAASTTAPLGLLLATLILRRLAWMRYRSALVAGNAPKQTLEVIDRFNHGYNVLGQLLPEALTVIGLIVGGSVMVWLVALAGLASTAAGWALKYTLVDRAGYTAGFGLPLPGRLKRVK